MCVCVCVCERTRILCSVYSICPSSLSAVDGLDVSSRHRAGLLCMYVCKPCFLTRDGLSNGVTVNFMNLGAS